MYLIRFTQHPPAHIARPIRTPRSTHRCLSSRGRYSTKMKRSRNAGGQSQVWSLIFSRSPLPLPPLPPDWPAYMAWVYDIPSPISSTTAIYTPPAPAEGADPAHPSKTAFPPLPPPPPPPTITDEALDALDPRTDLESRRERRRFLEGPLGRLMVLSYISWWTR